MVEIRPQVEINSRLEPLVVEHIARPALACVPERISPNALSLVGFVLCWLAFLLATFAPALPAGQALTARVVAGVAVFGWMLMDLLDGMQARRTGRAGPVGQLVDHGLDALTMPLSSAALILTLELDPILTVGGLVTTVMVYNAQLLIHHHHGRFVHPPTSGADAQVGLTLTLIGVGVLFYNVDRHAAGVDFGLTLFGWAVIAEQLRQCFFFYRRMDGAFVHHLPFLGLLWLVSAAYLAGLIGTLDYVLLLSFGTCRLNGGLILATLVDRHHGNWDLITTAWLVAIPVAALLAPGEVGGRPFAAWLPWLACGHLVAASAIDVVNALPALRGTSRAPHPPRAS